ncbi:hypothetical protein KAR91_69520, partial [Candidatus Pacearchaeota archaeon]|nr:hypothetical protein [Candidatus Pacearchaeota archaeon]
NLDHSNSNTLSGNTVNSSRDHDIVLSMSENNRIYHNNLMSFNIQAVDSHSNGNLWDNDYPSGGNYYRNYYDGVDLKNGKEQDQVGSDGIGDTPQLISNGAGLIIAQDRYPLMKPWGTTASIPKTLLDIYASAQYNPDSKKLNISAFAFSRISGKVIFGTAGYVINPVGLKGNLVYNPASESWESRNINLNSLNVGDYNLNITICSGSECGYDEAEFSIADKYGSLTGYLIDGTLSNESHKVTISGVEILLYDSNNYFSSNPVPIAANITNINGKYIFTRVPVGYYVVNVTVNDRRSLPASIEVRGNSVNDINVYANFLDILYPNMKQLSNSYVNIMEYDTRLMAEISGRFHEDIAHDIEAYDVVLFSLNIWGNPSFSPSWLTKYHKMYGNEYIVLFTKYVIEEMAKEGLVQGVLWYNSIESEDLPKYVLNMDSGRSENDLKNTDYYINVADLINNKNKNFEKDASNIGLMDEFDINDAQKVILDQRIQIVEIINTGYWNVIVPPYPEDNANFLSMRDTYGSYMEMVVAADKFKWKSRGVKSAIIISKFISMTTPAGATILVLNSVLDEVWTTTSAAAEIRYKNKIGETGALSFASWVTDLSKLPQSYELVSDFLKAEAKAPYYLNKNNDFSTVVNYESSTLKDVTTREKPISIIAEKKHLWSFDKDMDGEITINIKNTGNIESTYRVFSQGVVDKQNFWASINVPFLNIGANVGKIPMTVSNDFADAKLAPNGQTSMTMKFKGYYFLWNNYILHSLILRVFSGPFEIDKKQYFYRVVDPVNDVVNSRTSEGYLSVANDSRYLPSITKILTDNLTSGNPIIQKIFSTDNNTSSLEINMLYSFGTPVDLHVYDKEGNHVGFNNLTGKDEIGFSALYYGNSQNPEKIIIPNAANKTYTIQAVLGY